MGFWTGFLAGALTMIVVAFLFVAAMVKETGEKRRKNRLRARIMDKGRDG